MKISTVKVQLQKLILTNFVFILKYNKNIQCSYSNSLTHFKINTLYVKNNKNGRGGH